MTLSILFLWMLLAAWLMRYLGVRLEMPVNPGLPLQQLDSSRSRFPLRDIFFLTAVVAVLCSVLRFAPIPKGSAFDLGFVEGLVNCMLMATNAMVVSWCALSGRAIWVRWPIWLASPQSKNYQWMAGYHFVVQLTGAIAVFFALHAYRWRG